MLVRFCIAAQDKQGLIRVIVSHQVVIGKNIFQIKTLKSLIFRNDLFTPHLNHQDKNTLQEYIDLNI